MSINVAGKKSICYMHLVPKRCTRRESYWVEVVNSLNRHVSTRPASLTSYELFHVEKYTKHSREYSEFDNDLA